MTAPPAIEVLDDALLSAHYDPGIELRGRTYAAEDRITMLGSAPGTIKAICRGSGRSSYVLKVRWREGPSGVVVDDSCSCPLGGECKHCVAAIITARRCRSVRGTASVRRSTGGARWRGWRARTPAIASRRPPSPSRSGCTGRPGARGGRQRPLT